MASLEINSLVKKFSETTALNGITLKISDGEMVGVIGKSGAGKSTLLRLINRLIEPTSGSIIYDGVEITLLKRKKLKNWRSKCAMIFQQFNLIDRLDVLTNVLSGTLGIRFNLLKLFKIYNKKEKLEALTYLHNLDLSNKALQRVGTLSGGQQQRVAIARAMMQKPMILLADEPISSLDPKNSKIVMDDIKKINKQEGIMAICNLHSLDIAKEYCERLIGLSDGKIVFDGHPSELTKELAEQLYDLENE
ncbi:MAG: phosphonate ABC transporter ATP-binding protein [Pseudomonadota bacterium]|nr:phosphonate ABC transporter ATP-binding protein [Pseudomonadota bacterium]